MAITGDNCRQNADIGRNYAHAISNVWRFPVRLKLRNIEQEDDVGIIGQLRPNYDSSLCRGCKTCQLEVNCPIHNAKLIDGICQLDPNHCNACGRCVGKCPFGCNSTGTSGYRIYIGGHWGKEVGRGHLIKQFFQTEEEVLTMIEKIILFYKEQGKKGERFAHTIQRLGIDYVEKEIVKDAILERKNKILFND